MFRLRSGLVIALLVNLAHADDQAPPGEPPPPAEAPPAEAPPAEVPPAEPAPVDQRPAPAPTEVAPAPAPAPAPVAVMGVIKGSIIDNNTKVGLPAATIQIFGVVGGDITAASELDGTYRLEVPAGTYKLTISTPEYIEQSKQITVPEKGEIEINMNLDPAPIETGGEETIEIVDKIDTRKEAAVLAVRRAASVVSDAVSSQEIARTPDSNAGDAMKRVVAVSVLDGRYVALRGLEGRYVTALLNGVLLPSPEPDRNAVPLDLFPTSLLATMTVMKSYSAELPGQFGGGTLSIDTSSFPTSFEFKIGVSTSANTVATGQDGLRNAQSKGALGFFGFDNGDRALPSAVPRDRAVRNMDAGQQERIGESMLNVWTPQGETVTPNLGLNLMVGNTTRLGSKRVGYLASGMFRRNFTVREGTQGRLAANNDQLVQTDNLRFTTGAAESTLGGLVNVGVDLSPNDEIGVLGLYSHVGEDLNQQSIGYSDSEGSTVDITRMSFVERSLGFSQLYGKHHLVRSAGVELRWQANVATTQRRELDSRDLLYSIDGNGARQFEDQPGSGQHFWQILKDLSGGGGADLRARAGDVQLRAGTMVQLSSRELGGRRFRFKPTGIAGDRSMAGEELFDTVQIGPMFELEEDTLEEDAYTASLNTFAGYASAEYPFTEKLRGIAGARFEHSTQSMSNGSRFAVSGLETDVSKSDNDVLPAANLVFAARPDMNVRAAYSYTLARPRFRELAPFLYYDYIRRRDISGNPDLATTHIHNADLRWEWFPSESEVFAVSTFFKQFVDPIEQVIANVNADATFQNADGGNIIGAEVEARTTLGRIAPALDDFRLGTNVSVMRSRVQIGDDAMSQILTSKNRALYGQSPFVVNVNLGWAKPKVADLNLLYNVIGARIVDVGISGLPDIYEKPVHRLDFVASRMMREDLRLKLAVGNILNQKVALEQGDITVNSYSPGVSFSLALDWAPR
ncbi:MAG: TonB-dependent receptor domain-containing protein [Kofleriaceae bacterium]